MKFKMTGAWLALPLALTLGLATPAFAQVRPTTLSDATEPGSVIVFPKFVQGTVALPEGETTPISVLKISVVCPMLDDDYDDRPATIIVVAQPKECYLP
jgi:hypothetical protein